jgi:hypothetical protein
MKSLVFVCVFAMSALAAGAQEKIRVLITNSAAWETSGGFTGDSGGVSGGSRPQTVELMKTFAEKCKKVQITSDASRAEFVVLFDRQGGKMVLNKDSKIAVFERGGDMVMAKSVRSVGGAVKDACDAILKQAVGEGKAK